MAEKGHTNSGGGNLHRRGEGLGTGPVGQGNRKTGTSAGAKPSGGSPRPQGQSAGSGKSAGNSGRASGSSGKGLLGTLIGAGIGAALTSGNHSSSGSSGGSSGGGGGLKWIIIIVIVVLLLGGGGSLMNCGGLFNGGGGGLETLAPATQAQQTNSLSDVISNLGIGSLLGGNGMGSLLSQSSGYETASTSYNNWNSSLGSNVGKLDTNVTYKKRVTPRGNGRDENTIMVYMCGTDLESQYGMATNDLNEMLQATTGNNLNLIVYTGGCKQWKNSTVSSRTNMIFSIRNGSIDPLVSDAGAKNMTLPGTLSEFIQYAKKKYPDSSRYHLIFWDHGGGSITGFGYDEKFSGSASMDLAGIKQALSDGGVTFDMIGFDACLMATAENALMISQFGDYLVSSEESEPGIGWYYTDWLTALGKDPSMSTLEMGKAICDSFVKKCASECRGQETTLSVIDLAEFKATVPGALADFSNATSKLVSSDYSTVSKARSSAHEFASSSRIDQVDLADFAARLGTKEAKNLADTILKCVKYNNTSAGLTNAYGVSIYFPYSRTNYVDKAVSTYKEIGLESAYSKCIQNFASMEVSGQLSSGGTAGYSSSLLNLLGGGTNSAPSTSTDVIGSLLGSFMGSGSSGIGSMISGLSGDNIDFFSGRALSTEETAEYLSGNLFDASKLTYHKNKAGKDCITLTKDQWALVSELVLSMYYDDGEGYIDLGIDTMFSFDEDGNLLPPEKATWMTINDQAVAYYFDGMVQKGDETVINGHVPAYLNGLPVNLLIVFDKENPKGKIAGAVPMYKGGETELVPKNVTELKVGDTLDFVCDYYTYSGDYQDSYYLGDPVKVTEKMTIGSVPLDKGYANMMYRFTDIYNRVYWSQDITNK